MACKEKGGCGIKSKSATEKWAEKNLTRTTSKDVPGKGLAKKAAKAIEKRNKQLRDI